MHTHTPSTGQHPAHGTPTYPRTPQPESMGTPHTPCMLTDAPSTPHPQDAPAPPSLETHPTPQLWTNACTRRAKTAVCVHPPLYQPCTPHGDPCMPPAFPGDPEQPLAPRPHLPLSRPTPQTRMLATGCACSRVWSCGSTSFSVWLCRSSSMARPWGGRVRPGAAWGEGCRDRARHAGQRGDVLGARGDAVLGEGGTHPPPGTRRSMLVQGQLADAVVDGDAAPPGCQLLLAHLHPAQRAHREALRGTARVGAVWLPPAPHTGGGPGTAPRPSKPPPQWQQHSHRPRAPTSLRHRGRRGQGSWAGAHHQGGPTQPPLSQPTLEPGSSSSARAALQERGCHRLPPAAPCARGTLRPAWSTQPPPSPQTPT